MTTMTSDKAEQLGAGSAGVSGASAMGAGSSGMNPPGMNPSGVGTSGAGSADGTLTVEVTEIPVTGGDDADCGVGVAGNTKQVLSEVVPAVKADAQDLKFRTEDYVIEQPLKAIGIAAGVGFVLGVLWSAGGRRSSRRC